MMIVNRKITYRLYPNKEQEAKLLDTLTLHCRAYNTFLEAHKARYDAGLPYYGFASMCKDITVWRGYAASLKSLNAQSLQVTAKRVHLSFQAFFRRLKAGDTPGYPRFKNLNRYPGWGYKTHGDGWRFFETPKTLCAKNKPRSHVLRLSGIGDLRVRGKGRFDGIPKTAEIIRKQDKWYVSITFDTSMDSVARTAGSETAAFDWGVKTLLTIVKTDDSIEEIDNPKLLQKKLAVLKKLQQIVSLEEIKAKASIGLLPNQDIPKGTRLPITPKLKRLYSQVRSVHAKIANQRHDFYHKLSADLVKRFGFLATEELDVEAMTKAPKPVKDETIGAFLPNGAAKKASLNRNILDAAPTKLLTMIATKAEEAASTFKQAVTKELKPTQRCHCCGSIVPKTLEDRWHTCPTCYTHCGRDVNAAKTILRWFLEGNYWLKPPLPGIGRPYTTGTDETPFITV